MGIRIGIVFAGDDEEVANNNCANCGKKAYCWIDIGKNTDFYLCEDCTGELYDELDN